MKLGVMSGGIAALGWDKALAYCKELGLEAIELPCGRRSKYMGAAVRNRLSS